MFEFLDLAVSRAGLGVPTARLIASGQGMKMQMSRDRGYLFLLAGGQDESGARVSLLLVWFGFFLWSFLW